MVDNVGGSGVFVDGDCCAGKLFTDSVGELFASG